MSEQTRPLVSNSDIERQYVEYLIPIWKSVNVPVRRGSACPVEDFDGNEYRDMYSGIVVTNVDHRNEAVVDVAKEQLDDLVHSCTYVHPNKLAAALEKHIGKRNDLQDAIDSEAA